MAHERTHALIETRDFLQDLVQALELPKDIREQAHRLLRHYPTRSDVFVLGLIAEHSASAMPPLLCSAENYERERKM